MKSRKPVLVVEDDRHDTMTIRIIFNELRIDNELKFTGNGEEALCYLWEECFSNGAAGYMIKPVDYDDFSGVIRTVDNYGTISEHP